MSSREVDVKISQAVLLVSQKDTYQRKLFIFLSLVWIQIALSSLLNPIIFTNPLFKCSGIISTEAYACAHMEKCVYENHFTATFQANLYCDHRDARMSIQSSYGIGCILGMLTIPLLADLKGKRLATNISLFCIVLSSIILYFGISNQSHIFIALGIMMSGIGASGMAPISYAINSDFFSDNLRQKALIYYCAAWGMTDMFMLVIWQFIPYWIFYLAILVFMPITLLYFYFHHFFLESPHYLINSAHNFQQTKLIIQTLAKINNASQQSLAKAINCLSYLQQKLKSQPRKTVSIANNFNILRHNPKYMRAMLCLVFIKMGYYNFYYGAQGCLERTGFNLGVSVFLLGLGQFTGYMTGTKFIPLLRRKLVLSVTNLLTAILGLTFILKVIQNHPILASIILYICFTITSYYFSAVTLIQTQSFSSQIRSTAVGSVYGISYIIRLILPFMIGFLNQRGIHPIIACSILIVILGMPAILGVVQTFGYSNLEESLIEKDMQIQMAENVGNNKQIF